MTAAPPRRVSFLLGTIAAVAVVWLLRTAAIVAIPLAAAFFVALVVYPVLLFLRDRFPRHRWAALLLSMLLLIVVLGAAIWAIAESVDEAVEAAPRYSGRLQNMWQQVERTARSYGLPVPGNVLGSADVQRRAAQLATSAVRVAWEIASGLILVFFLVLLMLIEAPVWRENMPRVLSDHHGRATLDTISDIAEKVRQYLWVRTLLGFMSAGAAGIWLLLLDVDLVLVWVTLTFALNYIPNIGSIIAAVPPALMAAVQHGPWYGLLVISGLAVFEQIIGNYVDPRMQGRRLRISPVLVLVALIFWTWMWGPVGALLAVPMTVTLLAAAAQIPALEPFATLAAAERPVDGS